MSDSTPESMFDSPREIEDQDVDRFEAPDLSPEDVAKHMAGMMARVLEGTGLFEIKEMTSSVSQVHFFGRVKDDNKKKWSILKKRCLVAMKKLGNGFVGTQDIVTLKTGAPEGSEDPDDYHHKFGHLVSFGAKDLQGAVTSVCEVIAEFDVEPRQRREVMEAPMSGRGAPQSGGQGTGRRGAHPTGAGR